MAALILSVSAQSNLQFALEDFAGHDQGIATGATVDPFPIDSDASLVYFSVDIDGDGVQEIFVSRPDLASGNLWALYSDQLDGSGNIIKLGIIELATNGMRMGERNGVKGYYEHTHGGAGSGILSFNSFDEDGHLVALWEAEVQPRGKDKALLDSLHLGRFDPAARKPEVKAVPLRPVWQSHVKRQQAKLRVETNGRGAAVEKARSPRSAPRQAQQADAEPTSPSSPPKSWMQWLALGILTVAVWVFWSSKLKSSS